MEALMRVETASQWGDRANVSKKKVEASQLPDSPYDHPTPFRRSRLMEERQYEKESATYQVPTRYVCKCHNRRYSSLAELERHRARFAQRLGNLTEYSPSTDKNGRRSFFGSQGKKKGRYRESYGVDVDDKSRDRFECLWPKCLENHVAYVRSDILQKHLDSVHTGKQPTRVAGTSGSLNPEIAKGKASARSGSRHNLNADLTVKQGSKSQVKPSSSTVDAENNLPIKDPPPQSNARMAPELNHAAYDTVEAIESRIQHLKQQLETGKPNSRQAHLILLDVKELMEAIRKVRDPKVPFTRCQALGHSCKQLRNLVHNMELDAPEEESMGKGTTTVPGHGHEVRRRPQSLAYSIPTNVGNSMPTWTPSVILPWDPPTLTDFPSVITPGSSSSVSRPVSYNMPYSTTTLESTPVIHRPGAIPYPAPIPPQPANATDQLRRFSPRGELYINRTSQAASRYAPVVYPHGPKASRPATQSRRSALVHLPLPESSSDTKSNSDFWADHFCKRGSNRTNDIRQSSYSHASKHSLGEYGTNRAILANWLSKKDLEPKKNASSDAGAEEGYKMRKAAKANSLKHESVNLPSKSKDNVRKMKGPVKSEAEEEPSEPEPKTKDQGTQTNSIAVAQPVSLLPQSFTLKKPTTSPVVNFESALVLRPGSVAHSSTSGESEMSSEVPTERVNDWSAQFVADLAMRIVYGFNRWHAGSSVGKPHTRNPSSGASGAHGGSSHTSNTSNTSQYSSRKRSAGSGNAESENQNSENNSEVDHKSKRKCKEPQTVRLFACPYAKYHPDRYSERNHSENSYRKCSSHRLIDISRVKQHLERAHKLPDFYCAICFEEFKDRQQFTAHQRARSCQEQPPRFEERMTDSQYRNIKGQRLGNTRQSWYIIFALLFPDAPPPASPYVSACDAATLQHFTDFFQFVGPREIMRLFRERMNEAPSLIDLNVSLRTVIEETFEIVLPACEEQLGQINNIGAGSLARPESTVPEDRSDKVIGGNAVLVEPESSGSDDFDIYALNDFDTYPLTNPSEIAGLPFSVHHAEQEFESFVDDLYEVGSEVEAGPLYTPLTHPI